MAGTSTHFRSGSAAASASASGTFFGEVGVSTHTTKPPTSNLIYRASSGIGRGAAFLLSREGAKVIATGRNEEALQRLKSENGCHDYVVGDLTREGVCKQVVSSAVEKLDGKLTSVVNCAGVLQGGAMGQPNTTVDNLMFNLKGNLISLFEIMEHSIPHLKSAGAPAGPSIVNISSVNGKQSFPGTASYCTSKAAVDQLTRCASVDLAPDGIRVNAVNPGLVITDLQKRGGMSDEVYDNFVKRSISVTHPLGAAIGRCATVDEISELIAFLLSDKAGFLTGECIAVDGGRQNLGAR